MKATILFRYLLKTQFISFTIVVLLTCFIIFSIDLLDVIRALSSKNLPLTMSGAKFAMYKTVEIIYGLIPYVFLLSNFIALDKLNQTDQMTILKNLGYSIYRIIEPSLYLGLVIGIVNTMCVHSFSIQCAENAKLLGHTMLNRKLPQQTREIWVQQNNAGNRKLVYVDKINQDALHSVVIYDLDGLKYRQIVAEKAIINSDNTWTLLDGAVINKDRTIVKFHEKIIHNTLRKKHLFIYYLNPINADMYTIWHIIKLRKETNMPTHAYTFQLNLLLSRIFMPSLMALLAILFCYTHHRYAYRGLSLLGTVVCGFVIHFLSQALQSVGDASSTNVFAGWGLVLVMYIILLCCVNSKENH